MKLSKNSKGFTLVEIMIVVAIIGLLAAIAVPNFVSARNTARANIVANDLRLIDGAKEQYALANQVGDGAAVTNANVQSYLKNNTVPTAPDGTAYTLNTVGTPPCYGGSGITVDAEFACAGS